jgi:hypothetical protein
MTTPTSHSSLPSVPPGRRTAGEKLEEVGRAWFRPWRLAGLALLCGAVLLAPRLVKSLPDIGNRPEYQLNCAEIHVNDMPQWVPKNLVTQVVSQARLGARRSILEEGLTTEIATAFQKHPWVEKVIKVTKAVPARIDVELAYRRPVAMVEVLTGLLPVDAAGVLLPPTDFTPDDARRYPLISQPKTSPRGAVGTEWGDPQVVAAAKLAAVILPHWKDFNLAAIVIPMGIDLRAPIAEVVFELQTNGNSRIVWGRAPGVPYPLELTPEQKIGRLEECLSRYGGFDLPDGPYEIDIRHFKEITRLQRTATNDDPRRTN